MPKISLIIPLYNAGKYLRPCLDSVAAQTFRDFECLCVNDGSKDDTARIVQEYAEKDRRFVLLDKPNGGVSDARNLGLKAARAAYVAFSDQDDVFHHYDAGRDGKIFKVVCVGGGGNFGVYSDRDSLSS